MLAVFGKTRFRRKAQGAVFASAPEPAYHMLNNVRQVNARATPVHDIRQDRCGKTTGVVSCCRFAADGVATAQGGIADMSRHEERTYRVGRKRLGVPELKAQRERVESDLNDLQHASLGQPAAPQTQDPAVPPS